MEFGFTQGGFQFWEWTKFVCVCAVVFGWGVWTLCEAGCIGKGRGVSQDARERQTADSWQNANENEGMRGKAVESIQSNTGSFQPFSCYQWEASNRILVLRRNLYGF